jgi:hypothetical protein
MTLNEAVATLTDRIKSVSPDAVIRIQRRPPDSVSIRAYAPAADESAIKESTQELTLNLLINDGLDVQVLVYDITTSLPPDQADD